MAQPPGWGASAWPKRASSGPTIKKLARILVARSNGSVAREMRVALMRSTLGPSKRAATPMLCNTATMLRISSM